MRPGKLRPALIIGKLPGFFEDCLICLISSQTRLHIEGFDNIIKPVDADFPQSGLKNSSVVRVGRLAVVDATLLLGSIGEVDLSRLMQIRVNLANWLSHK